MINPELKALFTDFSIWVKEKHILVGFYFESLNEPEEAAAHLCQEMSTTQWHQLK